MSSTQNSSIFRSLYSFLYFLSYNTIAVFCLSCTGIQNDPKTLYKSCIESFSDEQKCHTLIYGTPPSGDLPPSGLFLRGELIERLQIQSKSYVRELLGEPDEKIFEGTGRERWIYKRPLTRYSNSARPDREFTVLIRTERVVKVYYKPPD